MPALVDALPAGVVGSARVQTVTGARVDTELVPELVDFQSVGGPPPELLHAGAEAPVPRRLRVRESVDIGRRHRNSPRGSTAPSPECETVMHYLKTFMAALLRCQRRPAHVIPYAAASPIRSLCA